MSGRITLELTAAEARALTLILEQAWIDRCTLDRQLPDPRRNGPAFARVLRKMRKLVGSD